MYLKTYSGDFERACNLVESFNKYNKDRIFLYLSVPEDELGLFGSLSNSNITVIADESFAKDNFAKVGHHGMTLGYANQQICKLTFYKTNLVKNYLCLDSDMSFIRDFYVSDFMRDDNVPYTVLVMDKDLSIERHYRDAFWIGRQAEIKKIYDFMQLDDPRMRTCHNGQIFNAKVLESLEEDFMQPRVLEYNDLLKISPYEFSWYNVWFQKTQLIKEFSVEPFFKMFHMRHEYIFSRLKLLRKEDYAQAYVGLVLNSKWMPKTPLVYKNPDGLLRKFFYKIITGDNIIMFVYHKLTRKDIVPYLLSKIFAR